MCEHVSERELNRGKGEMEVCESSKSDLVGFGEGKKILSALAFSLYIIDIIDNRYNRYDIIVIILMVLVLKFFY